jgi:hypothetical protein
MPLGLKGPFDMRTVAAFFVALSAVGISTAAAEPTAERQQNAGVTSFTAISPIFSQLVAFSLPANFKTIFENTSDRSYIREAVLKGETTDRWTQMITVTGAKGLAGNPKTTPESVAAGIAGGFKKACPDTFTASVFGPAKYGDHDAFVAVASCGKVVSSANKHSETALIVAVKGSADYYTIQWAERTPSSAENLTIDDAKWRGRLDKLAPIRICPIVSGEKAPYPSCLNKK